MKRRKWTGKEKLRIVLEGLRGQVPLGELCARHQLSQAQYDQWRDQLLNYGAKVFDRGGPEQAEQRLRLELRQLKTLIGELTVELKKARPNHGDPPTLRARDGTRSTVAPGSVQLLSHIQFESLI